MMDYCRLSGCVPFFKEGLTSEQFAYELELRAVGSLASMALLGSAALDGRKIIAEAADFITCARFIREWEAEQQRRRELAASNA